LLGKWIHLVRFELGFSGGGDFLILCNPDCFFVAGLLSVPGFRHVGAQNYGHKGLMI
jgi:hypothetical protein